MYSIAVKIEGFESRRRSVRFMHVFLGFFLLVKTADLYKLLDYKNFGWLIPLLLVASFSLFYGFFRKRIDPSAQFNFWMRLLQVITFAVLAAITISIGRPVDYIGMFIFAFLCLLLLFSERKVFNDTIIFLTNEGIKIPGNYKDHLLPWNKISNVVVREDFITVFHIKGKYLQFQVMQNLSTLEVAKINAFCKEKAEGERQKAEGPTESTSHLKP